MPFNTTISCNKASGTKSFIDFNKARANLDLKRGAYKDEKFFIVIK